MASYQNLPTDPNKACYQYVNTDPMQSPSKFQGHSSQIKKIQPKMNLEAQKTNVTKATPKRKNAAGDITLS